MSTRLDVNASKMCLDVICTVNTSTVTILMEKMYHDLNKSHVHPESADIMKTQLLG